VTARKLVRSAMSSAVDGESLSALRKAQQLTKEFLIDDLLYVPGPPKAAPAPRRNRRHTGFHA
jgi:hypothetical protein